MEAIEEATRNTAQKKTLQIALKRETKGIANAFKLFSDMMGNNVKETWDQVTSLICYTEQDGRNGTKITLLLLYGHWATRQAMASTSCTVTTGSKKGIPPGPFNTNRHI